MTAVALQAPSLEAPGLAHAFFTRQGGVSTGIYASLNGGTGSADDPAAVKENRSRMAAALGVPATHLVSVHQVHSPDAVTVEAPWPGERPRADAMVTDRPGLALAIATADCGPILFADAEARVIGAAHAGWKGALGGVLEATLAEMEQRGAQRHRIAVALGPMMRQPSYEVGPEFPERFLAADPANAAWFKPWTTPGRFAFDLPGYIAQRLRRAGVTRIEDLGLCTYADPERFFSYRRTVHRKESDYGRLISAIALR